MNLSQLIGEVSKKVDGTHTEYDNNKSFVVVPVPSNRYQSVLAEYITLDNFRYIEVSSKICEEHQCPDDMFKLERKLKFAKLAFRGGFLQVICYLDENMNSDLATAIISEVATFSDEQEKLITGQDIY